MKVMLRGPSILPFIVGMYQKTLAATPCLVRGPPAVRPPQDRHGHADGGSV